MIFRLALLAACIPFFSFAQEDARKLKLDPRKPIRIDYKAPAWNKDPGKEDHAALIIRDAISGRIVKVEVSETGNDTSEFLGNYSIGFDSKDKFEITLEIYIAPSTMLTQGQLGQIESMIKEGRLLRKPYFLRTENKMQTVSVFDSRAQALDAYQNYLKNAAGKPVINPAALEAQRLAEKNAEEKARLDASIKAENLRLKLEEQERLKKEELLKKQAALNEAEKAARRAQAQKLGEEGLALYQQENYKGAELKFDQAIALAPENTSYAFQHGVTLFRLEQYDRAIVILRSAKGEGVNESERDYFIGMAHMKKKEYELARPVFLAVKDRPDKTMASAAAFFVGVIDFQKEEYDSSKSNFEFVLDNSSDPKMDEQAEAYIEQIANAKRFQEMKKKKFILSANLGLMYDSNILNASASNAPTEMAGYRWNYGGSIEYRPVFSEQHEFSAILAMSDIYSTNKNFQALAEFQNTDPLITNFSLPYKWKGQTFGKGTQLGITPAYETLVMNADATGPREGVTNSTILKGDGTWVMNDDWFSSYAFEYRNDKSLLGLTGTSDQTATKVTLSTTQTTFKDKKKTTAVIYDAALANNAALGDDNTYLRLDLGASYLMPAFWETSFVTRASYGSANYPKHSTSRKDTAMGLTLSISKPLSEKFSLNGSFSYSKNSSNVETENYDKYILMTGLAWTDAF